MVKQEREVKLRVKVEKLETMNLTPTQRLDGKHLCCFVSIKIYLIWRHPMLKS